jgi:hypothetical protein
MGLKHQADKGIQELRAYLPLNHIQEKDLRAIHPHPKFPKINHHYGEKFVLVIR